MNLQIVIYLFHQIKETIKKTTNRLQSSKIHIKDAQPKFKIYKILWIYPFSN